MRQLISRRIEAFYNQASEETRLEQGMGVFEFERIKTLISKYLTSNRMVIVDVGGGTGKYSAWLAEKKHQVHLVEPIKKHLRLANKRSERLANKFSVRAGEARQLPFPNNFADLILLHGPLYHLQNPADRATAIREAKRVLKTDGVVLGFAINNTASTLVGLLNGMIHKTSFLEMCCEELCTGRHNPPENFPWLLAEAYYHRPEELRAEFAKQSLTYLNTFAVEGMVWLDQNYLTNMQHSKKRLNLLRLLELTQNDPNLLSFSPHFMVAASKSKK